MMQLEGQNEWFATWFDSPYYHILYQNRDDHEAHDFLFQLKKYLDLPVAANVLDLACGAGRHSRVLHQLGYSVTGCDLSANSIEEAKKLAKEGMTFFVHDMRELLPGKYDAVFNLFTSFGYFDVLSDNARVLDSVFQALENGGTLVIDFMNAEKVIRELKLRQEIQRGELLFHIKREVTNARIVKTIAFEAEGKSFFYQEKVQALVLADFQQLLAHAGFEILQTLGSYNLEPFDVQQSDRLILICRKP